MLYPRRSIMSKSSSLGVYCRDTNSQSFVRIERHAESGTLRVLTRPSLTPPVHEMPTRNFFPLGADSAVRYGVPGNASFEVLKYCPSEPMDTWQSTSSDAIHSALLVSRPP